MFGGVPWGLLAPRGALGAIRVDLGCHFGTILVTKWEHFRDPGEICRIYTLPHENNVFDGLGGLIFELFWCFFGVSFLMGSRGSLFSPWGGLLVSNGSPWGSKGEF